VSTTFLEKKNNAKTTITNNPLTAGGLSITLASSSGAKFPTTNFLATIWDAVTYPDPGDDPQMEVVLCDSRSSDTVTVNASGRGYAGTTGVSHATGSAFRLLIMKEHMTEHETAINALEAVSVGTLTPWTAFTPVIAVAGGGTVPTYTAKFINRYFRIGNTVWGYCMWDNSAGGTPGAGAGAMTITLPVAPADSNGKVVGHGFLKNGASIGSAHEYAVALIQISATEGGLYIGLAGNGFVANNYNSIDGNAQNDTARRIDMWLMYEVA
jgi:hypothetical protein